MTRFYHNFLSGCRNAALKISSVKALTFFLPGIFLVFLSSCEENPTIIGSGILPGSDFVTVFSTDTVRPASYTWSDDSIATSNHYYGYFGTIHDPYFGNTTSRLVTQLRLGSEWDEDIYTVDSVKMFLTFRNVKGDIDLNPVLRISEIAEEIYIDSTYYSNHDLQLTGYELPPLPLPRLNADTINKVELNLPVDFADYILRDTSFLFHSNRIPDFRSYFRGICMSVDDASPVFITMKLQPPTLTEPYQNYIIIYYHDEDNIEKEYSLHLDAVSNNARFNIFTNDYEAADPDKKIENINQYVKDTLTFVQGLNGVHTRILLPGLEKIKENGSLSNISVNKARLIVPFYTDGLGYKPSTAPSSLLLSYSMTTGEKYLVSDYGLNPVFFDGTADTVNMRYNFNIVSYVQDYLEDSSNEIMPELEILIPAGTINNVILFGNDASKPVRFELTYTRF
ncbi:MAG: DUF4270 family protein [Bacteroidales bacterium]|jgi:hypothetical protein|nr:DUF4270 family protein [Bacteroidales bacterium]